MNITYRIFMKLCGMGLGRLISDELYLKIRYYYEIGKKLDLENPKTFNEKLQWLKLYDRRPEYTVMVDKYEVKDYVADKIGKQYIIPTLGVWDRFDDIDFDTLPNRFVLKCTHDSGGSIICRDKSELDLKEAKGKINRCLKRNFYYATREWPYKNVKPRIIAEQYLEDGDRLVPEDYKVYCFNGKPKYIVVFHNRFDKSKELSETVYDVNWHPQGISLDSHFAISNIVEPRPECLDELLRITSKLSEGLAQARIDFYIVNNKIYFGEITLSTASGMQSMIPESLDEELGRFITLPKENA